MRIVPWVFATAIVAAVAAGVAVAQKRQSEVTPPGASEYGILVPTLYSTKELSRLSVECLARGESSNPLSQVHCRVSSLLLIRKPVDPMPPFEAFAADLAKEKKGAAGVVAEFCAHGPRAPQNETVAQLLADRMTRLQALQEGLCTGPCRKSPTARCVYDFLNALHAQTEQPKCEMMTSGFEVDLSRQLGEWVWIGSLGGNCNTQISLRYDAAETQWTYRQVRLTPEKCLMGMDVDGGPMVYSSSYSYALSDLPIAKMCGSLRM